MQRTDIFPTLIAFLILGGGLYLSTFPTAMISWIGIAIMAISFVGMALWLDLRSLKTGGIVEKSPLEIIFDPTNPTQRFWSLESPRDEHGNKKPGLFFEYRVEVKNNSAKTLRNASVTIEHIGQLPLRPTDTIFDKIKKTSCDLKPRCSELAPVIRWPYPKIQAGMLAGPSAIAYGPVRITASADDVSPTVRIFQFDYQAEPMLFD